MAFSQGLRAYFIFAVTVSASFSVQAEVASPALIRVRTQHDQSSVEVTGFGMRINGRALLNTSLPKKFTFRVRGDSSGWLLDLGHRNKKVVTAHLDAREIEVTGEDLRVNGQPADEHIALLKKPRRDEDRAPAFDVITILTLDDYLRGVVPSEMPAQWPIETLKAQVVASRSYALTEMKTHEGEPFHLDDSILHQVFNWAKYLGASEAEQLRINKAISETHDEILADERGGTYRAYFHSDCGGHTEEPSAVWGGNQKNGTVKDAHCALNTKSQWVEDIRREELSRLVGRYFELGETAKITDLKVGSTSASGRVQNLILVLDDSGDTKKKVLSAQALRQIVGFTRIKSANFQFDFDKYNVRFKGRGNGHGVGLCQQGAKFMALNGANYQAILKRYYPAAQLDQIR